MPQIGDFKKKKNYVKRIWWACELCGKERWVVYLKGKPVALKCRACSCKINQRKFPDRFGENNPSWKGGRFLSTDGYWYVLVNSDDFFYPMASHKKRNNKSSHYASEHRLVMGKHLNRCLLSWEVVHHRNGIKSDNRLENLELLPTSRQHIPSIKWQTEINKRDKKIFELEARIKELETPK